MQYACPNPQDVACAIGPLIIIMLILFAAVVSLLILIIKAVIYCMIFRKAGYHWALGLLMLVPIACAIVPFILAFGKWPIEKELQRLRSQQKSSSS